MRKLFFSLLLAASTISMYAADALSGEFSVSASKKVAFSKGNLQATTTDLGANWMWGFAEHQYDYVGNAVANTKISGNGTVSENGTVDLFGWSTAATFYGISKSIAESEYPGSFVDWGAAVGDGWFTLSKDELEYLFNSRSGNKASTVAGTADARYAKATVNSVNGVIVFPDGGSFAASEFTSVASLNTANAAFTTTTCTAEQWSALEAKGCVFLPTAGNRSGQGVYEVNAAGIYWSSTKDGDETAYAMRIKSDGFVPYDWYYRYAGFSVRLVTKVPQKGDTIRYEYAGNNLFYKITSKVEGKYEVVGANGGGAYPDYYPNPADKPKGNVIFPDSIEDFTGAKYAVVGIGNALTNCGEVTGLQVNNIIESLPSYGLGGTKITSFDTKNVKSIGYAVFSGLKLTSVHIGSALETFWAFSYMLDYATDITIDEANPNFKLEGTMLISKDGKTLAGMPLYIADAVYRLPNSLELIKDNVVSKQKGTLIYPKVIPFENNNPSPASYNMMNCPVGVVIVPCHLREDFTTGDFGKNFSMADTVISQLVYEVEATAGPNGSVAIVDTTDCDQVTITATPNVGCNFVAWSTGSTDPTLVLNVVADTTVKAIFEKQTFNVTVVAENGTVTAKDMMEVPVDLSQPVEYGMKLYLTATPDDGYVFDSWTNYNPATGLTVTENITVTATFKTKPTSIGQIDSKHSTLNTKRLINGHLFILRDGKTYTVQGQEIK